jgi:hypothetical protein
VSGAGDAKKYLEELRERHESGDLHLNCEGMKSIRTTYAREVVRNELHRRWEEIILS